jgi:hypothetical protein
MVRIRKRNLIPHQRGGPPEWEEWWEDGGIVVEEYNAWEKIVTVLHSGEIKRIAANDVQLVSRNNKMSINKKVDDTAK